MKLDIFYSINQRLQNQINWVKEPVEHYKYELQFFIYNL